MVRWRVATAVRMDGWTASGELLFFAASGCHSRRHDGFFVENDLKLFKKLILQLNFAKCNCTDHGFMFFEIDFPLPLGVRSKDRRFTQAESKWSNCT